MLRSGTDAIFQVPILSRSSESCAEPDSLKACAALPAVTVWGPGCAEKLNGIFAFAVDDPLEKASCDKNREVCDGEGECITFDLWESLNEEIRKFLKGISLKNLADKKKLKDQGLSPVSIIKPKV